jgi:diguanylate cyclase (GGDEF)-like protein
MRLGAQVTGSLERREVLMLRQVEDRVLLDLLGEARNVVVVPMVSDAAPVGVLAVEWGGKDQATLTASTVALLQQLASHAALSYSNAVLLEQSRRAAGSDALTGLANRRKFDETLAREVARAQRSGEALSLILLDVDHFKGINDGYGHQLGDDVLRHIGRTLAQGARLADLPARYGGEEFAVILPGATSQAAEMIAERLRSGISHGGPVRTTASAGVATAVGAGCDADALIAAADEALYAAKNAGRDRVVVAEPDEIRVA